VRKTRSSCYGLGVSEPSPRPYVDAMRAALSGPGNNDILTIVHPTKHRELAVGLLGRSKRGRDAEAQLVVHVEDNR